MMTDKPLIYPNVCEQESRSIAASLVDESKISAERATSATPASPPTSVQQFSRVMKGTDKPLDPTPVLRLWKYACTKCEFFAEVILCETRTGTLTVHISPSSRGRERRWHLRTSTVFHTRTTVRGHRLGEQQITVAGNALRERKTNATTQFTSNQIVLLNHIRQNTFC